MITENIGIITIGIFTHNIIIVILTTFIETKRHAKRHNCN